MGRRYNSGVVVTGDSFKLGFLQCGCNACSNNTRRRHEGNKHTNSMISSESNTVMAAGEGVVFGDDVLREILLRLPPKSVFKFRFVSNRWNDIITCPYFNEFYQARLRKQRFRLLAFIETPPNLEQKLPYDRGTGYSPPLMNIITVHPDDDKYVIKSVPPRYGFFIASSHGLVLTGIHSEKTYYVMNLVTRDYVLLPPPPELYREPNMALVYGQSNVPEFIPNYKIISVPSGVDAKMLPLQIYSSNTRKWTTKSRLKGVENFRMRNFKPPIVLNGFVHWYSTSPWSLVVLDTKDLVMDDGGENHVQLIMLPNSEEFEFEPHDFSFTRSSSDQLWFGAMNATVMRFWMLPPHKYGNGKATIQSTEWVVIDTIFLDSMHKDMTPYAYSMYPVFKKTTTNKRILDKIESGYLRLGALIPWNGTIFVVIWLNLVHLDRSGFDIWRPDTVCLYNLQSKSYELINFGGYSNPYFGWYPYMEPLTLSSYGSLSWQLYVAS